MDYKILLTKYLNHVKLNSGDTFIGPVYKDDSFSKEQWRELKNISRKGDNNVNG